ncbi:MAG: acyl-CoA/acyl-ACP dehydrogenase [Pseudomonadales bacterium]|nr:acyl-CoA/acyl-ACP dehydrogenase [Pseudomonadales bacterium]
MSLVLNEEQNMLRDAAREFCSKTSPVTAFRKIRDDENADGFDRAIWKQMTDLGWTGILIPEQYGGADFGFQGMGVVMEECGRTLVASPLMSTAILGASALNICGSESQKSDLLKKIAAGKLLLALAIEESAHHAPFKISTSAVKDGDNGYLLSGEKQFVLDGHVADKLIVTASTGSDTGISMFIVDAKAKGLSVERTSMVDSRNAANISLKDVPAELLGLEGGAAEALDSVLDIGRAILAAEMLGGAREAFDQTLAYLKEREQFGVVIGTFQALKHRAAEMFSEVELSQSAVMGALSALDEQSDDAPALVSLAKSRLCDTLRLVTNEAVQMFGGIGMTDEHDIGLYMKRARVCEHTFGNAAFHRDRYGVLGGY